MPLYSFLFAPITQKLSIYEKVILGPALITSSDPEETLRLTAVGLISAFVPNVIGQPAVEQGIAKQSPERAAYLVN